ncbi:MAG TPA: PaaI family thioesterase [bacterium]|jgi:acyl-coenzyme A thioesterase PaaI-like protein
MELDIVSANRILAEVRDVIHPNCRIAGSANPEGLQLKFRIIEGGDIEADFACEPRFQGYSEIVHGGVIAAMLDSAMVNSLFARRMNAVTAELVVRYREPVRLNITATVRGRIEKITPRIIYLSAEVWQEGRVRAAAQAKFMATPPAVDKVVDSGM